MQDRAKQFALRKRKVQYYFIDLKVFHLSWLYLSYFHSNAPARIVSSLELLPGYEILSANIFFCERKSRNLPTGKSKCILKYRRRSLKLDLKCQPSIERETSLE